MIINLDTGVGVIVADSSEFELEQFDGASLSRSEDGAAIVLTGDGCELRLPNAAVSHLLGTEPVIYLYATRTIDGVGEYLGAIFLSRDELVTARGI